MLTSLEQEILKNVTDHTASPQSEKCSLVFSRLDKAQIMVVKNLFDLDAQVQNLTDSQKQGKWSELVNSSHIEVSYQAQAQYIQSFMKELFPDLTKKKSYKR